MSDILAQQLQLLHAIRTGNVEGIKGVTVQGQPAAHRVMLLHHNILSIISMVIRMHHPVVEILIEPEPFQAAIKAFYKAHPPSKACMSAYGEMFSVFLETHPLTQNYPFLPDLARLDWLLSQSRRRLPWSDDDPGTNAALTDNTTLCLASSLMVAEFSYPVDLIRNAVLANTPIDWTPAHTGLAIWSLDQESASHHISPQIVIFLQALLDGKSAQQAYADAVIGQDEATVKRLISAQVINAPFARLVTHS